MRAKLVNENLNELNFKLSEIRLSLENVIEDAKKVFGNHNVENLEELEDGYLFKVRDSEYYSAYGIEYNEGEYILFWEDQLFPASDEWTFDTLKEAIKALYDMLNNEI